MRKRPGKPGRFLRSNVTANDKNRVNRMNATTVELDAGHLSLVSRPKEVADLILAAAGQEK
jgi:hypothetical protein